MLQERTANRFKALILVLLAMFLAQKFVSGQLYFYIGQRFGWLALVAIILLILLAGSLNMLPGKDAKDHAHDRGDHEQGHDTHDHAHSHSISSLVSPWPLILLTVPLVLGIVLPARPLGASAVGSRGVATDIATSADEASVSLTVMPGERNVLDWVRAMSAADDPVQHFAGQQADIVGFVYRDVRFAENQLMVARFTISCCVADASAIGLLVETPDAQEYPLDSWVRVKGTFTPGSLDGQPMPVLLPDEIEQVEQPELPYLYP